MMIVGLVFSKVVHAAPARQMLNRVFEEKVQNTPTPDFMLGYVWYLKVTTDQLDRLQEGVSRLNSELGTPVYMLKACEPA